MTQVLIVAFAGILAGFANAVAGGGTLISFPALLAIGVPAVSANVTSSVGLTSGYLGGSVGYHRELRGQRRRAVQLGATALVGGIAGALVLLVTPSDSFRAAVPYLVLLSCALLLVQTRLARRVARQRATADRVTASENTIPLHAGIFLSALYGSYFGAGLGVLLLAVMGIFIDDNLQRLNGMKSVLSMVIKLIGAVIFLFSGLIVWWAVAILFVTGYFGGLIGAWVARRLRIGILRSLVAGLGIAVGIALIFVD